ncbi:small ribosomal subunit Rsm22 family protein [Pseudodesulfovibrio tunisiensis]|uniref:small ribosomal subunit Rsm22 family protein n=1 Tax=Pseudodesulfovibrio tunisiensis TaxID=463192 RepID=UPI001FB1AEE8|nr:small ribosomal subunit Rsm22 family protein [Pseudodesulfovibrio tunisiensis]
MWIDPLFPELDDQTAQALENFGLVLKKAVPLKSKHWQSLPYDIRDMSRAMTSESRGARKNYMTEANFLSAYLYYFLPWNLYRQSRLFPGLGLDVPDGGHVVDLGSGPLTVPLALWISRPELRTRKLNFTCVDRSPKPMHMGLDIFRQLAGKDSPWRIKTVKGLFSDRIAGNADLLVSANALNELVWTGRDEAQTGRIARRMAETVKPDGKVLIIETGVRQTAHILDLFRTALMEQGLLPLAPCPHAEPCPMAGQGKEAWCHFNFMVKTAPEWLRDLSERARLGKRNATMNFLYMSREGELSGGVRTVSEAFPIPEGRGQYACSDRGLTLLGYRGATTPTLFPGRLTKANWPEHPETDRKSGALILPTSSPAGPKK